MKLILAVACAALAFGPVASAQEPAPPSPATLVEEVEVIARLPGPALWRVSTPTSQMWIVGLVSPLPHGFQWDNRRVAAALDGARELVLPPTASIGVGEGIGLLLDRGHILHLPPGQTARSAMTPEQAARFEATARSVGQDPAHYDRWRPVLAAMALANDGQRHYRLDGFRVQAGMVWNLAHARHVKPRNLANYKAMDFIKGLSGAPADVASACLDLASRVVERQPTDTPRLAEAWAKGDVKTVRAIQNVADNDACLNAIPAVVAMRDRAAVDWARDLGQSLAQPGKTVVAADLDTVTRKGGLLDQLKANGQTVIGPAWD